MALPSNLPQKDYIKAMYSFEETSGVTAFDRTGNHDGTCSRSNILNNSGGQIGYKGVFVSGSSDKVTITDHTDLKPTGNFSASAWINCGADTNSHIILGSYSQNPNVAGFEFGIDTALGSDHKLVLLVGDNAGSNAIAASTDSVDTGSWVHVAVTRDGTNINVYVDNGSPDSAAWSTAQAYHATNYVRIGSESPAGTDGKFFNGSIDEVIFWNGVALSAGEVATVFGISSYSFAAGFLLNMMR